MVSVSPSSVITSLANEKVKLLTSLRLEKFRTQEQLFLAEGARTLALALDAGWAPKFVAVVDANAHDQAVVDRAAGQGAQVLEVSAEVMAKITQKDNPQSVVGAFQTAVHSLDQLKPERQALYVALDRIRDPGNLGTIIRTADAVGAAGVILIGASCDPFNPESVRASTGSIFHVPIYAGAEVEFVALAQRWPGHIVGTAATATADYRSAKYQGPVCVVMGTEQSGMSGPLVKLCTLHVRIPMYGRAESLNVATACALALYAVREAAAP